MARDILYILPRASSFPLWGISGLFSSHRVTTLGGSILALLAYGGRRDIGAEEQIFLYRSCRFFLGASFRCFFLGPNAQTDQLFAEFHESAIHIKFGAIEEHMRGADRVVYQCYKVGFPNTPPTDSPEFSIDVLARKAIDRPAIAHWRAHALSQKVLPGDFTAREWASSHILSSRGLEAYVYILRDAILLTCFVIRPIRPFAVLGS